MNQIMPVGKGFVLALDRRARADEMEYIRERWNEAFPGVPVILIGECQIVPKGPELIMFEFTGGITPTFVAEFKLWWEEVNRA